MASTKRVSYKASISLSLLTDTESLDIPQNRISYIYIDHQYEINNMPVTYMGLLVDDPLYATIVNNRAKGLFKLSIKKIQLDSETSIEQKFLDQTFGYILSTSTINPLKDLIQASPTEGKDNFRSLLVGLIPKDLINKMRTTFNGVYNKVKESSIISIALEGTKPVIESLMTNKKYESIIIPPMPTRYKLIKYIFDKDPFYDTNFIMYMDFERSYLLSKNGKKVSAKDGNPDSVIFNISQVTNPEAFYEGFTINSDNYYMDVNPVDLHISYNQGADQLVDNITVLDENNEKYNLDIDYPDQVEGLIKKQVFVRCNNPELLKNELELNQARIQIAKRYVDTSVFTPNKTYRVSNFAGNELYNGSYMLESKQEVFLPTVDYFNMSVIMSLKKVGKLNKVKETETGDKEYLKLLNKALTQTGKRTTTASLFSKANVRPVEFD